MNRSRHCDLKGYTKDFPSHYVDQNKTQKKLFRSNRFLMKKEMKINLLLVLKSDKIKIYTNGIEWNSNSALSSYPG
ncbi:hypothetical protein DQM68_02370 [Leptospira mayottensis]|uniref:Uncharacterized protein n=2 Tax=Leptospira mayottensis TaxID=1137606 RepID=A0AA87MQK6_9LEPT|nr:hypothetical protein DQM68_02370 [Leptospira mayottensis]AXR66066.1 hypothetical protein DQM28_07090 [Leptospira mayottensis]AZQ03627.1 hypothetical protein LEP1GSC190_01605 [Leptospira mayottensis 200901116]EKS00551.1 hypothetical protein LEP1GSC125_2744 [Leptospira mayottensis 200901122]TGN11825.1 hypothetical protein EHR03_06325 [Leptospira mayottensis]